VGVVKGFKPEEIDILVTTSSVLYVKVNGYLSRWNCVCCCAVTLAFITGKKPTTTATDTSVCSAAVLLWLL
jgi:hypothetical protein